MLENADRFFRKHISIVVALGVLGAIFSGVGVEFLRDARSSANIAETLPESEEEAALQPEQARTKREYLDESTSQPTAAELKAEPQAAEPSEIAQRRAVTATPRTGAATPAVKTLDIAPKPEPHRSRNFLSEPILNTPDLIELGVCAIDSSGQWHSRATRLLVAKFNIDNSATTAVALNSGFSDEGHAGDLLSGKRIDDQLQHLASSVDQILVMKLTFETQRHSTARNIFIASVASDASLIGVPLGEVRGFASSSHKGAGPSEHAAEEQALERVATSILEAFNTSEGDVNDES